MSGKLRSAMRFRIAPLLVFSRASTAEAGSSNDEGADQAMSQQEGLFMRFAALKLVVPVLALSLAGVGTAAGAQENMQYNCQDEPIEIAIPGDRLDNALKQLRLTTQCPISGTKLARGKRSQPVNGTMTPAEALQTMLNGTGLEGNAIKGGFQITRLPR